MRPIITLVLSVALLGVGFAAGAAWDRNVSAARSMHAPRGSQQLPSPTATLSGRTWTSSNGITFSGPDLDRLDAERRDIAVHAAEFEYLITHRPSQAGGGRAAELKH